MNKKLFFLLLSLVASKVLYAQDPTYSHFWTDRLYLNPALAGSDKGLSADMMIRYQWPKITSNFATYSVGLSCFEPNLSGGWGFSAMQNVEGEGIQKTTEVSFTYAYRTFNLKKMADFGIGLRSGMLARSIDYNKLIFSDQIDPVNGVIYPTQAEVPSTESIRVFNANFGFDSRFYLTKKRRAFINLGISANNITSPKVSFMTYDNSRLPRRYSIYASWVILSRPSGRFGYILKPLVMHTRQGNFGKTELKQTIVGIQSSSDHIFGGVLYRSSIIFNLPKRDALFFNFGINWAGRTTAYSLSYGYEVNVSHLAINTGGSHEVSFTSNLEHFMLFKTLNSMGKRRFKNCPSFKPVGGLKAL